MRATVGPGDAAEGETTADEPVAALVDAARDLMLAVGLTDADAATLADVRAEVQTLTTRLRTSASRRRLRRSSPQAAIEARAAGLAHQRTLSAYNPMGLPLQARVDGDEVRAWLTAGALAEGPPESVHGGVIGWLMDTVLGVVVQAQGTPAVTAKLEIRYRARTPLDVPLELGARILDRSGRKLIVEGWIDAEGVRTVDASGIFVQLPAQVSAGNRKRV